MISPLQCRTTGIPAVLRARRTVRVTYHRGTERSQVDIVSGDEAILPITHDVTSEDLAELIAERLAHHFELDVSRVDAP